MKMIAADSDNTPAPTLGSMEPGNVIKLGTTYYIVTDERMPHCGEINGCRAGERFIVNLLNGEMITCGDSMEVSIPDVHVVVPKLY